MLLNRSQRVVGLMWFVLLSACWTSRPRGMNDDMRSALSGLLYSDTAYVFTVDDISSVVPVGQLDGFESQLVRYYYPSYVGSDSLYNVFRSGMVPEFGLFGISFAGTRNDTVYVFGAILRDGKCMALDKMPCSLPYDDAEAHLYIFENV